MSTRKKAQTNGASTNGNGHAPNGVPLTKAELAALDDRPIETVYVPEWKRSIRVRMPPLDVVLASETGDTKQTKAEQIKENIRLWVVDEHGEPMYDKDSVAELMHKNPMAVMRIARHVMGLNETAAVAETDAAKK